MTLKIAAFPKCYIDQIAGSRTMSVFDWVQMARRSTPTGSRCTTASSQP